jgi:ketosteroid isomerase-like protein
MDTAQLPNLTEIKRSISETNDLFNFEVFFFFNDTATTEIYTSTARILPPGAQMIAGREAIKRFWSDLVLSVNAKSAELTSLDVIEAGEGLVEIGCATLTVEPPGQSPAQMEVKYVVFWREENGRWKWHVDIWKSNA